MSRSLITSISVVTIGIALVVGAWALGPTNDSRPPEPRPEAVPARSPSRAVVREVPGIATPWPAATPFPTPQATPFPTLELTPFPTPDPTPVPTPEPAPEPAPPPPPPPPPAPEPTAEPTPEPPPPSVPPDLVLTKEDFLAGRLVIPRIGVDAPFEERWIDDNAKMEDPSGREAVAWYPFKSLPNGGENVFLAGHLQLGGSPAVFWNIPQLEAGDRLVIVAGGVEFHYSVVSKELPFKADSLSAVNDPVDSEVVTLMTCGGDYLPQAGDYSHRWIVRAARIN